MLPLLWANTDTFDLKRKSASSLLQLIYKDESSARVQTRARILLLCNRSQGYTRTMAQVADGALCSIGTVRNVKKNYFVGGLEAALYEKPRPAVYQRPYDPKRPVVCLDELSKVLRSTLRGEIAIQPGESLRQDYEYKRHGVADLFLAVDPLRGRRQVRVRDRRTAHDFAEVVHAIVDADYPDAECIVLVIDNLNTHGPAALYEHFPPVEARRIANKIEWHFTTNDARIKLKRLYPVLKEQNPA